MYASTDCTGSAVLADTNYQTCNTNIGLKVEDYMVSTIPQYGLVYKEWIGTDVCSATGQGASWIKTIPDCIYWQTDQAGTHYFLQTTCMGSTYVMNGFNDTACTSATGHVVGPHSVQSLSLIHI